MQSNCNCGNCLQIRREAMKLEEIRKQSEKNLRKRVTHELEFAKEKKPYQLSKWLGQGLLVCSLTSLFLPIPIETKVSLSTFLFSQGLLFQSMECILRPDLKFKEQKLEKSSQKEYREFSLELKKLEKKSKPLLN